MAPIAMTLSDLESHFRVNSQNWVNIVRINYSTFAHEWKIVNGF